MTWLQRYRIRHYVRNSIWIWPAIAIVTALVAVRLLHALEAMPPREVRKIRRAVDRLVQAMEATDVNARFFFAEG